ncbi:MAG: sulfite exporter TauE/SafE family protein [Actinobacteria bacterium]|nr:sulfite exporter TauE/SafE family protein [Actinomycetota bacterium]
MTPLDIGEWVRQTMGGSLLVALPVAVLAGLASFFSPCVVPLVPGYLSYATGIGAADIVDGKASRRRMLLGTSLFVLGIAVVFVTTGAAFGGLGAALLVHQRLVSIIAGVLAILMGLAFAGLVPILARDVRTSWAPRAGLVAAPVLGLAFALGWTPCIGPALTVVLTLSLNEGSAVRGAALALAYSLGLGLPFVVLGVAFVRFAGALAWVRAHQRGVMRAGGILMALVGLALVTGWWDSWMAGLRQWASGFGTPI